MTAKEHMKSGKVVVMYVTTHTNHQTGLMECKHLPLPKSVIDKVQSLLASGVKMENVLDGRFVCTNYYMYM